MEPYGPEWLRLAGRLAAYDKALRACVERLETSQPARGGKTATVIAHAKKVLKGGRGK